MARPLCTPSLSSVSDRPVRPPLCTRRVAPPQVKLFSLLSSDRLVQLCRGAVQLDLAPGEELVAQHDIARSIFAIKAGSIVTAHEGSDEAVALVAPETFGESALAAADEVRRRTASLRAGENGATVVSWAVSAVETLVGFSLQAASFALNNRKMLQEVKIGARSLAEGLTREEMVSGVCLTFPSSRLPPSHTHARLGRPSQCALILHAP